MSHQRPGENEVLQAADLRGSPKPSAGTAPGRGRALLLGLLLTVWSYGVYEFFSLEPAPTPDPVAVPTPLPGTATPETSTEQPISAIPPSTPKPEAVSRMLTVISNPPGAMVLRDTDFAGRTPLELPSPSAGQTLLFQLNGYEGHSYILKEKDLEQGIEIELTPVLGKVKFEIFPAGSEMQINGQKVTLPANGVLTLPLLSQELTVSAKGFQPETLRFTPAESYERRIQVSLSPLAAPTPGAALPAAANPTEIKVTTSSGLEMILPEVPIEMELGSARGTAGRQSNEVVLRVKLTRPFRISKLEISNGQFRKFRPGHDSGAWKGINLNADSMPVVNLTWEDAVGYCNWLSRQEGLPPAYIEKEGGWEIDEKNGSGYRLPTEAEWESVARLKVKKELFGWGNTTPPPASTVNLAGQESAKLLAGALENYRDAFPGPAPVDQAGEGPLDLRGLYGNVSEWVQDAYSIPPLSQKVFVDPVNSAAGKFHVIKGASWQSAGITDLRIARRQYGNQKKPDLGFRVARSLETE